MIFVFDIDGTICFDGKQIPMEIEQALEQLIASSHQLIFASARPIRDLLPLLNTQLKQAILIGGNGAITQINQHLETKTPISNTDFVYLQHWIDTFDLDYLVDDIWHYSKQIRQPHPIEQQIDPAKLAENRPLLALHNPIKTLLLNLSETQYHTLKQHLEKRALNVITYHEKNQVFHLDITAQGINKYRTLRTLIGDKKYIAFGNDLNDLMLLQHAQYSVCIGDVALLQSVTNTTLSCNPVQIAEKITQLIGSIP
ncbi:HAD-superfamily hydrolase [Pasteurella multocida subsp. multocida OH4807]|nr:HAD-superfamily hydrolase [Pasteurella multocida subsp. multocida OH4807]